MNPLFSVILTTYNRSQLLARAIRSVLQQNFTEFELVIVDDHSSDNTRQVIAEFSDDRIIYICQTENQGVSTSRNTGIQQAKGEYICFLDDDDEYLPAFLKEINHFLEKRNEPFVGLIWTGIKKIYTANNLANEKERVETQLFTLDSEKFFLMQVLFSGITIHRLCFQKVSLFNPELKIAEDIDFVLRILEMGIECAVIPKILINIYIHEQPSLSRSICLTDRIKNLERFLLSHQKFLNQHLTIWLSWHLNLVGDYYHTGKKKQARKLIWHICKKKWFLAKTWELFLRFELLKPVKLTLQKLYTSAK